MSTMNEIPTIEKVAIPGEVISQPINIDNRVETGAESLPAGATTQIAQTPDMTIGRDEPEKPSITIVGSNKPVIGFPIAPTNGVDLRADIFCARATGEQAQN